MKSEPKFMSEAYQQYALNLYSFSDAQQAKLATLFYNFMPEELQPDKDGNQPHVNEVIDYVTSKLLEPLSGKSIVWYTLGEIFDAEETVTQRDIIPGKVYSVLADPDYGYLVGNSLINPPIIGEVLDEAGVVDALVLESGRHRTAAIVTLLSHYGLTEEDMLEVEVPCFSVNAQLKRIISANKSRGATKTEELMVKLSASGVDVRNMVEVWTAYLNGDLPGTAVKQRNDAFSLVYILGTNDLGISEQVTEETRRAIATAILSSLKQEFSKDYKNMLADNHFLTRLLDFAKLELASAVKFCVEEVGVTNLARGYKSIASVIVKRLKNTLKSKTLSDGTEFDISIPKPIDKVTAVKTTTTASRPKKEKAAPTEGEAPKTKKAVAKKPKATEAAPVDKAELAPV